MLYGITTQELSPGLKEYLENKIDNTGGVITSDGGSFKLKNNVQDKSIYMEFINADGARRAYLGFPSDNSQLMRLLNSMNTPFEFLGSSEYKFDNPVSIDGNSVDTVVEQGTNSNGSYIRYESGLQVCWNNVTSLPELYEGILDPTEIRMLEGRTFNYPASFIDNNIAITFSSGRDGLPLIVGVKAFVTPGVSFIPRYYSHSGSTGVSMVFNYMAIGKWK